MWCFRQTAWAFLALSALSRGSGPEPLKCDLQLLLTLHRQVEPVVAEIAEIHFNFTGGRHYEVIEVISVFQVDRICRSVLRVVEAMRQTVGFLVCPIYFEDPSPEAGVALSEEKELLALVLRLETWAADARSHGGFVMEQEAFSSIEVLVQRFLAMTVDFARSLSEDMSSMFRAPNYVVREMTPAGQSDTAEHARQEYATSVDVFKHQDDRLTLKPEFLSMLRDMPSPIYQASLHGKFQVCDTLPVTSAVPKGVPLEFLDEAGGWSHRDVTGAHRRVPSPLQLLQAVASRGTRLSNLFISVQVSPYLLTPAPKCGSKQVIYDPSHCLVERQWAGYFFHLNPLPPFNVSVVYSGRPLGPHGDLASFEVHHVHVPSMDTQWSSLVSLFKSMNHHSPDTLFISPFVGNCQIIDRLMGTGTIKPKIVYMPFNPLIEPMNTLNEYGYELLHVEHTYATFLWRPFFQQLAGPVAAVDPYTAWLRGWHCSPHARFIFDLEIWGRQAFTQELQMKPFKTKTERDRMQEYAVMVMAETPGLRYFLERGPVPHGRCGEGICECFPPYRGELCELEDPPLVPQDIKAAIHYMMAETERDLLDMERSLKSLWQFYNHQVDYPVVVFHEGLTPAARRRLVLASLNRLWFALVPRFKEIPPEWAEASRQRAADFSVGYRAMTRWRSGPLFLEPALAGFDYAMTLDTDSYFPAHFGSDPFEVLHTSGLTALFPHLGRESASVVVNFMHYFLLYCRLHKLDPRRSKMIAALIEKNFKWYQQCLMLDIEVLRLDWFRSETYQDFFRYMDSVGGFWLHRWGNNPLRTFAVALLLRDEEVKSVVMPYAHQDFCSCGPGMPKCTWDAVKQEYFCEAPAGAGASHMPAAFTLEELSEGLLDLQPWRGSARQLSRRADMEELREQIMKLGMLTDGNYGHPDQAEAVRMIEEAAEAFAEPAALTASKGEGFVALKPVQVTRALGLRDLKLPRKVVSSEPQIDILPLESLGSHHLVLLSSGATSLSDQEVINRIRGFAGQPKAASLLVAADAAARNAQLGAKGPQRFGCCIVGVFEVGPGYVEPAAKKAKKDGTEKVRARHILLKHKDLRFGMRVLEAMEVSYALASQCRWAAWAAAKAGAEVVQPDGAAAYLSELAKEWRPVVEAVVELASHAAKSSPSSRPSTERQASAGKSGGNAFCALTRMATQFGLYWRHRCDPSSDRDTPQRCLAHALQAFHQAHWAQPPWRGTNLGGWFLLEPGPASPFFETCHATGQTCRVGCEKAVCGD
eukprot:g11546.t1